MLSQNLCHWNLNSWKKYKYLSTSRCEIWKYDWNSLGLGKSYTLKSRQCINKLVMQILLTTNALLLPETSSYIGSLELWWKVVITILNIEEIKFLLTILQNSTIEAHWFLASSCFFALRSSVHIEFSLRSLAFGETGSMMFSVLEREVWRLLGLWHMAHFECPTEFM